MAEPHNDTDDLITELTKDHDELRELFDRILATRDDDVRAETARDIIQELVKHSAAEEQWLYPAARKALPDGPELTEHEITEHSEVEVLLKKLEGLSPQDEAFMTTVRKIVGDTLVHVEEEERELFPRLREALPRQELRHLGDRVRQAKAAAPTRPHPLAPDHPPFNRMTEGLVGLVDRTRDKISGRS